MSQSHTIVQRIEKLSSLVISYILIGNQTQKMVLYIEKKRTDATKYQQKMYSSSKANKQRNFFFINTDFDIFFISLIHMFEPFSYLWKTVAQQINDQITIVKEIAEYYRDEIKQSIKTSKKMTQIKSLMYKADNYSSWKSMAQQYDQLPNIQAQLNEVYSPYYDYEYLQQLVRLMTEAREEGDTLKLIEIIRSHTNRNIANTNSPMLYRDAYTKSKRLIEQYQEEYAKGLQAIMRGDIPQGKKIQFFGEMRHAVGRSALLLSGGAIMGMYHIGVVQALIQADCLPRVIAGSSAGSIIASVVATHTREELFNPGTFNFAAFANQKKLNLFRKLRRAGRQGCALDIKVLEEFLRENIGQYTFQEAYDKFGVILNITVTGTSQYDPDRLLNYLTAPNVLIWSASAASCAIPFIYGATDLYCKDYEGNINKYTLMNRKFLDGSIGHDLPMNQLSILFNVNNFIVSQTNPWVIPFMDYTEDLRGLSNPLFQPLIIIIHRLKQFILSEVRHRASQIAYIFPNAITKFLNLLTQSYVGDITIWPKPRLQDYIRILENPTSFQAIMTFVQGGKQRSYPKVCHIKSTMFMERQIELCYRHIRNASRLQFLVGNRQIEDAGEQEFMMKQVVEEDEDEDGILNQKLGQTKRLFKKVSSKSKAHRPSPNRIDSDQIMSRWANKGGSNKLTAKRNQSFLLPREKSFGN